MPIGAGPNYWNKPANTKSPPNQGCSAEKMKKNPSPGRKPPWPDDVKEFLAHQLESMVGDNGSPLWDHVRGDITLLALGADWRFYERLTAFVDAKWPEVRTERGWTRDQLDAGIRNRVYYFFHNRKDPSPMPLCWSPEWPLAIPPDPGQRVRVHETPDVEGFT
jgi:hypothetical protein